MTATENHPILKLMEELNQNSENERRRHPRFRGVILEYDVVRVMAGKNEIVLKAAMIRDLSLGGVSMFVGEELSPGERIILKLYSVHFPDQVIAVGTVVWCKKAVELPHKDKDFFHIGIEFFALDKKNQALLERMILLFDTLEHKPNPDIRELL